MAQRPDFTPNPAALMNHKKGVIFAAAAAVIAAGAYWGLRSFSEPPVHEVHARVDSFSATHQALGRRTSGVASGPPAFHWSQVEADDYQTFIRNLQAIGCPEETIRSIVVAEVNREFRNRAASLPPPVAKLRYWEPGFGTQGQNELLAADEQRRNLEAERLSVLKQIFGEALADAGAFRSEQSIVTASGLNLAFLSADKAERVRGIVNLHEQRRTSRATLEQMDDSSRARLVLSREAQYLRAALSAVLSAHELEQYDLFNSGLADRLRGELAVFHPTEQEFKAIYRVQSGQHEKLEELGEGISSGKEAAIQTSSVLIQEELRQALGQARYEEYVMTKDSQYRALARLAERQSLPAGSALAIYRQRQATQRQMDEIHADVTLNDAQRMALTYQAAYDANAATQRILGPKLAQKLSTDPTLWFVAETLAE